MTRKWRKKNKKLVVFINVVLILAVITLFCMKLIIPFMLLWLIHSAFFVLTIQS